MFGIKIKDIRALPDSALKARISELQLELGIERRKVAATGVASKVTRAKNVRKSIARILTILNERGVKL